MDSKAEEILNKLSLDFTDRITRDTSIHENFQTKLNFVNQIDKIKKMLKDISKNLKNFGIKREHVTKKYKKLIDELQKKVVNMDEKKRCFL